MSQRILEGKLGITLELKPRSAIFGGCALSNEIDEKTTTIALAHHVFFFLFQYLVN